MEEIINSLKLYPQGQSISEDLLKDIVNEVSCMVSDIVHIEVAEMPTGCKNIIKELSLSRINKLGSEGIKSESHEGISLNYEEGISPDILKRLKHYRKLPK